MSFRHLWAVTKKEINHIFRDSYTLFLVILTPTLLLLFFSYALTVDLKNIPIAVLDFDRSQISRAFVQEITAGQDLKLYAQVESMDEIEHLLIKGEIKAGVIIGPDFSNALYSLSGMPLQIIIDGTEPESGGFAVNHIGSRAEEFIGDIFADQFKSLGVSLDSLRLIELRVRTWYNPSLKPRNDLIPGLISLVLGMPALSVALTIAHEHEHGTMEQLMATPISRGELLLGKMLPYLLVGLVNVIVIPALARLWFKIPFNGSFPLFFVL